MKLAPLSAVQPTESEGGLSASLTSTPGVADLTVSESADAERELIARLEKATGPDRELDLEIATVVFDLVWKPYGPRARALWGYVGATDRVQFYGKRYVPHYTSSLDAALTLVPEGYDWTLNRTNGGLTIHACAGSTEEHFGETPAIALCIAALKARAAIAAERAKEGAR